MFCYSAGQVKRWHTRDHVIREENIAAHTWNVVTWILLLHPEPSKNLLWAAQFHDVAEAVTGDMPRWFKKQAGVQAMMEKAEDAVLETHSLITALDHDDAVWLRAVDMFDAWMFIRQNVLAGNRLMRDSYHRSTQEMDTMELPQELATVYKAIKWGDKI